MIGLTWTLARAGGWSRVTIVIISGAIVSALLLVGLSWLLLPQQPEEELFQLINDPGTRVGAILSVLLLTVPLLALLYQGVRLGTAARERRLAGLRLAGATVRQVRLLGGIEVGAAALLGAVLGIGLFALLREWFGGVLYSTPSEFLSDEFAVWGTQSGLGQLIPRSISLPAAYVVIVVLIVGTTGFVIGAQASAALTISPLGVSRRQNGKRPRPWAFLVLMSAALLMIGSSYPFPNSELPILLGVALTVFAMLSLAPWVAYRLGHFAQERVSSAAGLLAARRLVQDPRTVGRAAAATGAIGLIAGGGAATFAQFLSPNSDLDAFFVGSYALVLASVIAALLVATATMAIHSIETIWDRKRSMAGLVALGASPRDLQRSQLIEALLVALTSTAGGYLLGSVVLLPLMMVGPAGLGLVLIGGLGVLAMVYLGTLLAVTFTRPILIRALASDNLRLG